MLKEYKERIRKGIDDYMLSPVSERIAIAVKEMADCWLSLDKMEHKMCKEYAFTPEDAENWNAGMQNADGTTGGHWTIEQTNDVAESIGVKFEHITEYCWNTIMNMMYSDYYDVAEMYGLNVPKFYAELAKAFIFDKDAKSPQAKISAYYKYIAKE